jgi:hypothetical protein
MEAFNISQNRSFQHMTNGFEKGRDPLIPVRWPVVILTPKRAIEGKQARMPEEGLNSKLNIDNNVVDSKAFNNHRILSKIY